MRLDPIEKPKGFIARMAYWGTRRRFGKVMTPMKVILARMPGSLRFSKAIAKLELNGIRLEPTLHFMLGILASMMNGCDFCTDLGRPTAIREHLRLEQFSAPYEHRAHPVFSPR